jgi:hypothetical protein
MTPHEAWHGSKPDLSHLRIIGCNAYVHVPKQTRTKLESHAVKGRLVGYIGRTNIRSGWKEERTSSFHEMSSLTKAHEACRHKQSLTSIMKSSCSPLQGRHHPPQQYSTDPHESTLCKCRSSRRIWRNWRNWRITQMNQQSVYRHVPTSISALSTWQIRKDISPSPTLPLQKRNHKR